MRAAFTIRYCKNTKKIETQKKNFTCTYFRTSHLLFFFKILLYPMQPDNPRPLTVQNLSIVQRIFTVGVKKSYSFYESHFGYNSEHQLKSYFGTILNV